MSELEEFFKTEKLAEMKTEIAALAVQQFQPIFDSNAEMFGFAPGQVTVTAETTLHLQGYNEQGPVVGYNVALGVQFPVAADEAGKLFQHLALQAFLGAVEHGIAAGL